MLTHIAEPAFHGRLRTPAYYEAVTSAIRALGRMATLRAIASRLNELGHTTPSGLTWNRERVRSYMRNTNLNIR